MSGYRLPTGGRVDRDRRSIEPRPERGEACIPFLKISTPFFMELSGKKMADAAADQRVGNETGREK